MDTQEVVKKIVVGRGGFIVPLIQMMELENCGEMFPDTRNIRQSLLWHMLADHQWRKVPLRI